MKEGSMDNTFGSVHFNTIGAHLKNEFGCRVIKLSLDGGFTCPNRDGSAGTGGCLFCSPDGSGTFAGTPESQIHLLGNKWPTGKYIAYFQNHTNTYAPAGRLRALWDDALARPGVIGLAVATRPDCLPEEVLELLAEYNRRTYLWVELGLQTSNEKTAAAMNRCYKNAVFENAMAQLTRRGIKVVVHLILGLPGESRQDMLTSADYAASFHPFGLKLHMLHVLKNTGLAKMYPGEFRTFEKEEYIRLVVDILERLPGDITIHRLTGDAPREELISPLWSRNKQSVLNGIQQEFKARGSYQGIRYSPKLPSL
jgi:uncharacterized protein